MESFADEREKQDARPRRRRRFWGEAIVNDDEGDRIFLDLAEDGCGVGCRYCYISRPDQPVRALGSERIDRAIESLDRLVRDGARPLMSIGCDTEIAADRRVAESAGRYLRFAARRQLPAQLATKFPLDPEILEILDAWPSTSPMPAIFTTITTVRDAARLEPGAPPAEVRAVNFDHPRRHWTSYALVKPFGPASIRDADQLLDLFEAHRPDGVVVGTRYRSQPEERHTADDYVLPVRPAWRSSGLDTRADAFVSRLAEAGLRAFKTTRCVTAFHNATTHGQIIHSRFPALCVACGACSRTEDDSKGRRLRSVPIERPDSTRPGVVLGSVTTSGIDHRRASYQGDTVTSRLQTSRDLDDESIHTVRQLVSSHYNPDSPTHDLSHLERVAALAAQLAAENEADQVVVQCAAWLHDLHRDARTAETAFFSSPEDFDQAAVDILTKAQVPVETHAAILAAIHYTDRYSFSDREVSGSPSVEATCVRDADNLDALGAIGVARAFSFGGSHQIPIWDPETPLASNGFDHSARPSSTIHHFYDKLLRLQGEFETERARAIARSRTEFLQAFADELRSEWEQDVLQPSTR